jgi:hypothetical protein
VITHQGGRQTASDQFAIDLASAIGLAYQPSAHGVMTDSLSYADTIAECTNLSIGYERAHSAREYLDVEHVLSLTARLCAIDTRALTAYRTAEPEPVVERFDWRALRDEVRTVGTVQQRDRTLQYLDPAYAEVQEHWRDTWKTRDDDRRRWYWQRGAPGKR